MARPIKEGFNYFPFDTQLDKKMQAVESVFKNDGFTWVVKFWQEAYQHSSGEVSLIGYQGVIQAENSRITIEKQSEILKMCIEIGLIYKVKDGIYSSSGIKKRIDFLLKNREKWRNYGENRVISIDNAEDNYVDNEKETRQSKVKESKVNKIKESNTPDTEEDFINKLRKLYLWVNLETELKKIDAWLLANPHRKKTRRFIINWLNRIEKPMSISSPGSPGWHEKEGKL